MSLLLGVVAVWIYLVVGFAVLAFIASDIEPFGERRDFGAGTGLVVIFFWPVVAVRTIVRRSCSRPKRIKGAKCQSCKNGFNGTNGNGYQPCGCEQSNTP